jgi:hypothetical protein
MHHASPMVTIAVVMTAISFHLRNITRTVKLPCATTLPHNRTHQHSLQKIMLRR